MKKKAILSAFCAVPFFFGGCAICSKTPAPAAEKKNEVKPVKKAAVKKTTAPKKKAAAPKQKKAWNPKTVKLRPPVECVVRGGLPNFFRKCQDGKTVKVAYFGGSITEQGGWRVHSLNYFRKQYPKATFKEIFAAIGGTGSMLGVFRMDHDVLAGKPDLVFVEFAVNDGGTAVYHIRQAGEGIVRKIRKACPDCDICFVYTVVAGDIKALQEKKGKRSVSVFEEIAEYYAIPSVNFGVAVADLEKAGKLVMRAGNTGVTQVAGKELDVASGVKVNAKGQIPFSKDGVHPYTDTGHVIYMNVLARSLEKMKGVGKAGAYKLGKPMLKECLENTKSYALNSPLIKLGGKYQLLAKNDKTGYPSINYFYQSFDTIYRLQPGATIEFKFKGSKVAIYHLLAPDGCVISYTVDKRKPRTCRTFDAYCTWSRRAECLLAENLNPDKVHTVKITVTDQKFDKKSIIFKQDRAKVDKNPALYNTYQYTAGTIFVVGELVK